MKKFFAIFIVLLSSSLLFSQNNDLENQTNSFEIVVEKIEDKTITYQKKLPLDLLSDDVKKDKYQPLGTAILQEDGTFICNINIFTLFGDTFYTKYYIRDEKKKTYAVEDIVSFDQEQKIIIFTAPTYNNNNLSAPSSTKGYVKETVTFSLPNVLNFSKNETFEATVNLPMKYDELYTTLNQKYNDFCENQYKTLSKTYSVDGTKGVINSQEWTEFSFNSISTTFPLSFFLDNTNKWKMGNSNPKKYALKNNGFVNYNFLANYFIANIQKPNNTSLKDFISNPKKYMEYCLEAHKVYRRVETQEVAITSLGNPSLKSAYTDYFGRTWQVCTFDLKFSDAKLLSFALPTPNGLYLMYTIDNAKNIHSQHQHKMAFLADNYFSNISATYKNWKEYLALQENIAGPKPQFLNTLSFTEDKKNLIINTPVFNINLTPDLFETSDDTGIELLTGIRKDENNKPFIEIRGLTFQSNPAKQNYKFLAFNKYFAPENQNNKKVNELWKQIINQVPSFDGTPYNIQNYTFMDYSFTNKDETQPSSAYVMFLELLGPNQFEQIKEFSQKALDAITFN